MATQLVELKDEMKADHLGAMKAEKLAVLMGNNWVVPLDSTRVAWKVRRLVELMAGELV